MRNVTIGMDLGDKNNAICILNSKTLFYYSLTHESFYMKNV